VVAEAVVDVVGEDAVAVGTCGMRDILEALEGFPPPEFEDVEDVISVEEELMPMLIVINVTTLEIENQNLLTA
jgi:hypothetical protein